MGLIEQADLTCITINSVTRKGEEQEEHGDAQHSTVILLNVADIRDGAESHFMGPFAHSDVPIGLLASQIPS